MHRSSDLTNLISHLFGSNKCQCISILVIAAATMLTLLVYIVFREKKGSPLFTPLLEEPVKADQSLPASTKDVEMTI